MALGAIRTLLVDDEPVIHQSIREMLSAYSDFSVIGEADSKFTALEFLAKQDTDLVLMDIQMPGGNGFELAEQVHKLYPNIIFVFLTGHADFALDGYDYGPVDFLVKPVDPKRFAKAVERIRERMEQRLDQQPKNHLSLRDGRGGCKILAVEDVAYVERADRKVWVVCRDGDRVAVGQSIQELEDIFAPFGFFRCHQSYLVPQKDICAIRRTPFGQNYCLELIGGSELAISRKKYYELRDILKQQGIMLI